VALSKPNQNQNMKKRRDLFSFFAGSAGCQSAELPNAGMERKFDLPLNRPLNP
jgi:hypothetical protein